MSDTTPTPPISSDITLSSEQLAVATEVETTNDHFFITGKAGTGKSVLLQYIKETTQKNCIVAAPTGVAALNVGAQTIHSLFNIAPAHLHSEAPHLNARTAALLKKVEMVIIDEISMVRCDLMEAIDSLLRQARRSTLPFGGAQMVLFGDLFQLPPVLNDPSLRAYFQENNEGFYFFNARAWRGAELVVRELTHIYRQTDNYFIKILNSIRTGEMSEGLLDDLNQRVVTSMPREGVVILASTNATVNRTNSSYLDQLPTEVKTYLAKITGQLEENNFPTEAALQLKVGAQVMFLRNDKDKRWVNGSIGRVESLDSSSVQVSVGGTTYKVEPEKWEKIRYSVDDTNGKVTEETVSSFTQLPLRLAWSITIHKSQGQTYDAVAIDLGSGAFAHGQSYVALSRCRSLEGLYLKRAVTPRDVIVDPAIIDFMSRANL
jgi:ATP-dependent exoDNAse (exonuclease V) alpha subunit